MNEPGLRDDMLVLYRGFITFLINPAMYYWIGVGWLTAAVVLWRDDPQIHEFAIGGGAFILFAGFITLAIRYGLREHLMRIGED